MTKKKLLQTTLLIIGVGVCVFLVTKPIFARELIETGINLKVLTLTSILSFLIRMFFVIAALAALLFLLLGALGWVTSGGEKEAVKKAQDKIQGAVVGLIIIVAVLAILVTLETIVFKGTICVGLTCPVTIPGLVNGNAYRAVAVGDHWQCVVTTESDRSLPMYFNNLKDCCATPFPAGGAGAGITIADPTHPANYEPCLSNKSRF